jgi:transcriptional regulator with PAS, ATPase and Fis domain
MTFAKDNKLTKDVLPPKIAATPIRTTASSLDQLSATKAKSLKAFIRAKEKEYLEQVLTHTAGDKEKAAKALKISLATLYRKLPDAPE